jgi:hypothetical protein
VVSARAGLATIGPIHGDLVGVQGRFGPFLLGPQLGLGEDDRLAFLDPEPLGDGEGGGSMRISKRWLGWWPCSRTSVR